MILLDQALYSNIYPQSQGESFSFKRKEIKFSFLRQFIFFDVARVRKNQ
jgi:hypothetical protein